MFVLQLKSVDKERGETDVQIAYCNMALIPKVKKYIYWFSKLCPTNSLTAQEIHGEALKTGPPSRKPTWA